MRESAAEYVEIDALARPPYDQIVAFPSPTRRRVLARISQMERLGVDGLRFAGRVQLGRLRVLGKGYTGVVVEGSIKQRAVAIKIRRTDSPRRGMAAEAKMLRAANCAGVGPQYMAHGRNILVMELLRGKNVAEWSNRPTNPRAILRRILRDCHKLDATGLDHGELSNISKHVIISGRPTIIDFESSSKRRRASNVTSAAQALLIGLAPSLGRSVALPPKTHTISALKRYRRGKTNFDELLEELGL